MIDQRCSFEVTRAACKQGLTGRARRVRRGGKPWRVDPGVIGEDDEVAAVGGDDRKRPVVFIDNWGLPRSTGSIEADRSAALLAQRTARTDAQRAAVALRLADIRAREVALTPAE